jgi:branched-chain amino acid transport system substrate-binding protein
MTAGLAIAALAAVSLAASATAKKSGSAAEDPVIIGFAMAQSGFMAEFDGPDVLGAKLAIDDINKAGGLLGRQLRAVEVDSKTDKQANAQAATKLVQQGAQMIVSSCDLDFGGPGALIANSANKIVLGCAGDPRWGLQGIGKNAFTINTITPGEGSAAAEWAYYKKKWRTVYLLNDSFIQYTKALGGYFKQRWGQLGGTRIVGEDNFKNSDASFTTQVSRIRSLSSQPDFIYMTACAPGGPTVLRQLRAAGVNTPVLSDNCVIGDFWVPSVPKLKNFFRPRTSLRTWTIRGPR